MTDLFGSPHPELFLSKEAPHHPSKWYVWSSQHTGYHVRGRYGFAWERRFAGKFTRAEADAILAEGHGDRAEPVAMKESKR